MTATTTTEAESSGVAVETAVKLTGVLQTLDAELTTTQTLLQHPDTSSDTLNSHSADLLQRLRAQLQARDEAVYPELAVHKGLHPRVEKLQRRSEEIQQALDALESPDSAKHPQQREAIFKLAGEHASLESEELLPVAAQCCNSGELEGLDAKYQAKRALILDACTADGNGDYQAAPKTKRT